MDLVSVPISTSRRAKLRLLQMHFEAGVGHIGGNLSAMDVLLALGHVIMTPQDELILSKGHAAGALYVMLWTLGKLSDEDLLSFHQDGTHLPGHPPANAIPEIPFATGSLGHGLALACGMALGRRLQGQGGRIFCVTSDGEWNEGSSWEALIFARQHRLDNLSIIIDVNGLQGFGLTKDIADLEPLAGKFNAFGLETAEIDGHDTSAIARALRHLKPTGPRVVIARTEKGCGVSFMRNRMEWHYLPMTPEQYRQAVAEIQACEMNSAAR